MKRVDVLKVRRNERVADLLRWKGRDIGCEILRRHAIPCFRARLPPVFRSNGWIRVVDYPCGLVAVDADVLEDGVIDARYCRQCQVPP